MRFVSINNHKGIFNISNILRVNLTQIQIIRNATQQPGQNSIITSFPLWALKGVETIDVATGQKFNMRAMVLWTINDFPTRSSLSGWSGQGYKACPTRNEDTPYVRVLGKTAYVGHRRFLKKPHKWRRSLEFNGEIEDGDPPRKFDRDQIQAQLARLPTRVKGKHPSYGGVKIKRNVLVELNWTKRSIFYELEYWSFLTLKHNLDIMHIEKNVLEAILNTLLMNDKSKDTAKARQDLKKLGIRSGLWLGQTKNGKCSKPQAAYSFSPENRKKFCQFIKGVKLPDGFGSNFKHKVTDNDTNITGLKSHDCHIMMQRLLPYGLQQYLPDEVAKPIIELCSFFKQICSTTLMEDDMLKAQSKVVDILCNLELIYPPAFFDIMIHLVIHLPLEALEGGPIRPRWMFPFERFMKKLKGYVRNKAKPEGSIAEGYVAEEALTFSSHYFRDVTTKFNRPDRNVDPPPPTCQFQVFRSLCKSIGLRSVIRFDAQELKKVIWYVLHNSPEIDTYRSQFKSKFPNKDMKEEFLNWFGSQTLLDLEGGRTWERSSLLEQKSTKGINQHLQKAYNIQQGFFQGQALKRQALDKLRSNPSLIDTFLRHTLFDKGIPCLEDEDHPSDTSIDLILLCVDQKCVNERRRLGSLRDIPRSFARFADFERLSNQVSWDHIQNRMYLSHSTAIIYLVTCPPDPSSIVESGLGGLPSNAWPLERSLVGIVAFCKSWLMPFVDFCPREDSMCG
ncbi:hypothetical protein Tco_0419087 [Tanacetum coccineum]